MIDPPDSAAGRWLNRTVIGAGITSFFADAGYEMAAAVLPGFLLAIGVTAAPAALGFIDGTADFLSNAVKLATGWLGDRLGRRKPFVVLGYALTGCANSIWALATGWRLIFAGKLLGWFGKGVRGPLRNAILADAVAAADRGKAFGLHRAADTVGAVVGPLAGAALLYALRPAYPGEADRPFRWVFLLTLAPGLTAALAFAVLVRERPHAGLNTSTLTGAWGLLPTGFRRYLVGVGVFGLGDFSRALLVLAATELLRPRNGSLEAAAAVGAVLYAWHNACQAATAFPVGALSDVLGRRGLLVGGYALGAFVALGMGVLMWAGMASVAVLGLLFALSGAYVAVEEALEGAMTADLVSEPAVRGTAYGVLGAVNGAGDLLSSLLVGVLWQTAGPAAGFAYAAAVMAVGAWVMWRVR
jgi:MFS family permease